MMKKRCRSCIAFLLAAAMLLAAGCSSGQKALEAPQQGASGEVTPTEDNTEKSMGRYLENEAAMPEELADTGFQRGWFQKLDGGELAVMGESAGLYISADKGESWTLKDTPWYEDGLRDAYISMIALAPNGAAAAIYSPQKEEEEQTEEAAEEDAGGWQSAYRPQYRYVDPEGNAKELEWQDEENYIHSFWFGKDSRLYAFAMGGKVYEIDAQDGDAKQLFEIEGIADYVCFTEKYMVLFGSRNVSIYDLESGMLAEEDKVLQDFVTDSVGQEIGSNADSFSMVAAEGEQADVIYLAYRGGLYRHVIGGSAMEQIADGSTNSLSDPMMYLNGFAVLPDNEFAILYNQTKLYHYVYDPDIPTVPDEQVSIYSLREDYAIRQAVSLFQKEHPQVYVRYELGMAEGSGMTAEDAVKNLNTKLMSGSGSDLLVLDGLPAASYEEKGVLLDLNGIVHDMGGENTLFKNIVDACRDDGKLWYLPVRFRIPVLVGDKDSIGKVTDLASLADRVEELRKENPQGGITGFKTEDDVLRTLALTSSAAWTDRSSKAVDREKLIDFLTQARRIWQVEKAGYEKGELDEYQERYNRMWSSNLYEDGLYYGSASSCAVDIAMEEQRLGVGVSSGVNMDFNMISTLAGQEENFDYALWQGQVGDGFIPWTMVGICAEAQENALAQEFFRFLYEEKLQDLDLPTGYPINKASFEKMKVNPRAGDAYGEAGITISGGGDKMFSLEVKWADEEAFARLKNMLGSVQMVCSGDAMVNQAVLELGKEALNGSTDIEDTVEKIVKKAAIYLAE